MILGFIVEIEETKVNGKEIENGKKKKKKVNKINTPGIEWTVIIMLGPSSHRLKRGEVGRLINISNGTRDCFRAKRKRAARCYTTSRRPWEARSRLGRNIRLLPAWKRFRGGVMVSDSGVFGVLGERLALGESGPLPGFVGPLHHPFQGCGRPGIGRYRRALRFDRWAGRLRWSAFRFVWFE